LPAPVANHLANNDSGDPKPTTIAGFERKSSTNQREKGLRGNQARIKEKKGLRGNQARIKEKKV
jgi:hypothetical protein